MLTNVTDTQQVLRKHLLLLKHSPTGTSLEVQWLGFHASTAGGLGSIPRWGSWMPHSMAKKKKKPKHNSTVLLGRVTDQFLLSRSTTRGWGLCVLYIALSWGQQGSAYLRRGQRSPFFLTFRVEILRFGGFMIMEVCKHPMQASKHPFNSLNKQYWCLLCERQ